MTSVEREPIRVLLVDDEPGLADVVATHLERQRDEMTVVTETNAADGMERLANDDVDCVVSDHDMPGENGLEFLRAVRDRYPELPFILFTGNGNEEIASDAISAGVTEYLQKDTGTEQYALLANRIERAVDATRAETALEESERRLSTLIANLQGMVYRCRNEPGWPMEFVSDGARDLTGYAPESIESGEVSWGEHVLVDEDRQEMWNQVQTALAAGEPFEVTYRIETREGERRWIWERGRAVERVGQVDVIEGFITDITARKERERELQAEREFSDNVINAIDDVFYVVTLDGRFVRWNDRLNEVTGYSDAEISDMSVTELFPDAYRDVVVESATEARERGSTSFEAEVLAKDGDRLPFEFRGTRFDDLQGSETGIVGIGRDVSERTERERELERYRTLVESVGDPMYVMAPDGSIAMVNRAMADHVGYDRETMEGESPLQFATPESVDRANEAIEELLEDDDKRLATFELESVSADGTRRFNEDKIAVLTDDEGNYEGSVGVIRDISDRKARERELEGYETIIQAVGDPVYTLDDGGVFTFVNDAMEALSGYDSDELVGEHVSTVMREDDVEAGARLIRDLLGREEAAYESFEMDLVTRAGERVPCENQVALLPLEDGEFRGTAGVIRDISERKQRERRLEEFASVVSHDLRNPLNVARGRVELARETGDLGHLDAVVDATDRMERLIDGLLKLARQGRDVDEVEPVAIDAVATEAWDHVVAGDATLTVETTSTVDADRERLVSLFENLFRNAVEHGTGDGRAVEVHVGATDGGFFVEDDGVGIEPERRDAVFERGHSTGSDGTGFGLAIVDSIVTAHGWEISVTDGIDGGARFEIAT